MPKQLKSAIRETVRADVPRRDRRQRLGWETSHLPELSEAEVQAMLDIMSAWYHQRSWELADRYDWRVFWQYADRVGLGGALGALAWEDKVLPRELGQEALRRYLSNQLYYEQALKCCGIVQQAARVSDVGLKVLKGPSLVGQGYLDPGVRPFSDLDMFTRSKDEVMKLASALGAPQPPDWSRQNLIKRLRESECVCFFMENWELEFRYPLDPPGEPMFQILLTWRDRLLTVPGSRDEMLDPDPGLHFVFLIQHMAIHHLFSRFFWFLDLAVLVRHCGVRMDFEMVEKELDRLGLSNAAAAAGRFCRWHIDPGFPVFQPRLPAWNYPLMTRMVQPREILEGSYGVYHHRLKRLIVSYLAALVGFYLVADPPSKSGRFGGFGTQWSLNRFRNAWGFKKPIRILDIIVGVPMTLLLMPLARLMAFFITGKNNNASQ